jgi:aquaporin Z
MPASRRRTDPKNTDETWLPEPRRLLAELFGTFALTAVAAGADVAGQITVGEVGTAARAVAPGLLVLALVYALGDVSGAHFNPAVTLAFAARRLFPVPWLLAYWLTQVVAALAAGIALLLLFPASASAAVSAPHVDTPIAFAIEIFLSMVLVTVILGTADRHRIVGPNAAIAVGATISLCGLIALPVSAVSMNPARSIGPALATGHLEDLWIYVVGPIIGGLLAVVLATALHGPMPRDSEQVEAATGRPPRRDESSRD